MNSERTSTKTHARTRTHASAVYYAAKAAELKLRTFVPVQEVKAALKEHIAKLTDEVEGEGAQGPRLEARIEAIVILIRPNR